MFSGDTLLPYYILEERTSLHDRTWHMVLTGDNGLGQGCSLCVCK
jgi:hypothetical protein